MEVSLESARRVSPVFDGARLLAARELVGQPQTDVAQRAGISPSALSQAERNMSRPTAATLSRLAEVLDVPVEAFARRPGPEAGLNPQFRHLRRTPQREQRQALRFVEAAAAVVSVLADEVLLPTPFDFEHKVDPDAPVDSVASEIEAASLETRLVLGATPDSPLSDDCVVLLERNGIVVVRDPETDEDIDAYSAVVNGQPIVVLDGGAMSVWDRDNFNLAHELGHLVMHRDTEHRPGTRSIESQAHRFAGAFLAPADAIRAELPGDLDWTAYLDLKNRWGLSIAALVRRARDLGKIDEETYTRAMKQRSAYGWRKVEPGNELRPLPQPSLLARAAEVAELNRDRLAARAQIPTVVADRILGEGPRPTVRV